MFYLFHSPALEYPWSREPQEHDSRESLYDGETSGKIIITHRGGITVTRKVQPQEPAISLEPYPNPESDSAQVTDSAQVSQEQPESLHHTLSRLSFSLPKYSTSSKRVPHATETVETFSRFVHLSVLWLVINTAVLALCIWKNERLFKGTKWLPDAFF